jgi:hypothetical protein
MQTSDIRVMDRIIRTEDGETFHKYEVGGVSYPSAEAVEAVLEAR